MLSGCATQKPAQTTVVAPPPPAPPAPHQLTQEAPEFMRLPNMPADKVPVRVGVLLPFSASSPTTRLLASSMLKAAQLALFDSGNHDILLMTADENGTASEAAAGAQKLLDQGAEIIIGPLFAQSVTAVAPLTRDKGVPLLAFSTDTTVAGNGVYLLSFLPQNEVKRVVDYAAQQGHKQFGALIPQTSYGEVVAQSFKSAVTASGAQVADVERFSPSAGAIVEPAQALAKTNPDAILIAQGGALLRGIVPTLSYDGIDPTKVKLLGTGLWDDPSISREALLNEGWFAAPEPDAAAAFDTKYRAAFGTSPPQLAALAYDAVSLIALLSSGQPYHRFTQAALTDPNGFTGIDGIFRLNTDGTTDRGLAVLAVEAGGAFRVIDPAPKTFQKQGS
jgi:ABC-type branched-subunit amino acid transport system substrate-binding protein